MPGTLSKDQRSTLEKITLKAREAAEVAARAALDNLAVHEERPRAHLDEDQRRLRNRLRARGRALGDRLDPGGTQAIDQLAEATAYVHWHRLLFTRFLAENHVLHTSAEHGNVPVTLEECDELAPELFPDGGAPDGFDLACRFAAEILPGIFRLDDPVLDLRLAPNHVVQLRRLLDELPAEIFRTDDALGWTYQFWQAKRKDEVNKSGVKIGARELPAVTQLFTEDYMVEFLLHNSLGAWWAGRRLAADPARWSLAQCPGEPEARQAAALPPRDGLPGIDWTYLRFVRSDLTPAHPSGESRGGGNLADDPPEPTNPHWTPAGGTFKGWPKRAAEIRFLDPCMGSGHFLVFALPILARLRMEEEGLSAAAAVAAVLRDNLHGLEIDERCTQIAAFNVALTAWRLGGYQALPVLHLACSGLTPNTPKETWIALAGEDERLQRGMARLYGLFKNAPVLGSLIDPRKADGDLIEADFIALIPILERVFTFDCGIDNDRHELGVVAQGLTKAADLLVGLYTIVLTNVPYLGRGKQDPLLREYCSQMHPAAKTDVAACFIERCTRFCLGNGSAVLVTPSNWMYMASYRELRRNLLLHQRWNIVARLGARAFESISGEIVNVTLIGLSRRSPNADDGIAGLDASSELDASAKRKALELSSLRIVPQRLQLQNPDARISLANHPDCERLSAYCSSFLGLGTGDYPHYGRLFWEIIFPSNSWAFQQATVSSPQIWSGREHILAWDSKDGRIRGMSEAERVQIHNQDQSGQQAWGRTGVAVGLMNALKPTLYTGEKFEKMLAVLLPKDPEIIPALWVYCNSSEFAKAVRELDAGVVVPNATLEKVPFDLAHWQQVASEQYPNGLPKPYSDNPTQWLFNGHPKGSDAPLQVAVARLLGYRWPRQTGSEFPDCPALDPDGLESHADADGIVCLPPINREAPAAVRLRTLLAAAFGAHWTSGTERDLLAATGAKQTNLEDWLQDAFFEQHCKLFHNRPFVWQLWDGRKDGFHALVNYHRLDRANLEKLTYSYLGDWIRQQDADAKADKPGAAERLGAARALETELVAILEGEPPYDLFIRWKPLTEQPLGWQPDINDGVRLNIRPFMQARDVGKKGAGILRAKPNIKWDKDRGTEPHRDKSDYPWFWHAEEPPLACPGGPEFTGKRWNNVHLTLARKRAARATVRQEGSQ
ncbi:hypothetical protein CKO25_06650 [Thiocapsa imhoffii]|uniref:site-specific DNA-methyltransferase (adenine-specific) n=1 Tax=Thiocapsa imhoffii TaxID=382777 RepID=A0A9X0WGL8_9GAMM|nr:SAM-dependent DNA methyltransferase [Thiocapsa imhoffii]MBK1644339.1 hypothetical protein [Thiocapsa imhoffii]